MSRLNQMSLPVENREPAVGASAANPYESGSDPLRFLPRAFPDVARAVLRAIVGIRWALAQTRIDDAARAILQLNRLIENHLPRIPESYIAAARMLQASVLAAEDRFDDARMVLRCAPNSAAEDPSFAAVLHYIDWKSRTLESLIAAGSLDFLNPMVNDKKLHRIFGLCISSAVEFDCLRPTVAANLAAEALELARASLGNSSPLMTLPATLMAQVAYEQGRFDEAEILLRQRLAQIRTCGFVECVVRAFALLARLAVRRGDHRNAMSLLRDAEGIARASLAHVVVGSRHRTGANAHGAPRKRRWVRAVPENLS